jgi:hypothetical protein
MIYKYHFVYITTNTINNKKYIGVHNTNDINDGYIGSGKLLQKAVEKYGKESFVREIIKFFDTKEEAFEFERFFVNEQIVNDEQYYNLVHGGKGGDFGEKVNKKIGRKVSDSWKNKSEEQKQEKIAKWKETFYGKSEDEINEIRKKYHNTIKEYYKNLDENILKERVNKWKETNSKKSEEEKQIIHKKISEGMKYKCGIKNNFYGKHHSKESRSIISKKMKENSYKQYKNYLTETGEIINMRASLAKRWHPNWKEI